jgi:hypothetical protein
MPTVARIDQTKETKGEMTLSEKSPVNVAGN